MGKGREENSNRDAIAGDLQREEILTLVSLLHASHSSRLCAGGGALSRRAEKCKATAVDTWTLAGASADYGTPLLACLGKNPCLVLWRVAPAFIMLWEALHFIMLAAILVAGVFMRKL